MEFLILLSPSKTQVPDRRTKTPSTIEFAGKARELVTYFQDFSIQQIATQMKIGILRPLDLIKCYRLEMGQKISAEFTSSLYQFWKEEITSSVQNSLASLEDSCLLNLASDEYFKALDVKRICAPIIEIMFQQEKDGKRRTIAIHAKKARGALANYILRNRVNSLQKVQKFNYQGYHFEKSISTDEKLLFIKRA